ncbi:MAG: thiamine diphosphokinase [Rhizobiaceae bacterium]
MKSCVILLGGDVTVTDRLKDQCSHALAIAADSGIRHADALGLTVDLWMGDFDSATPALHERYKNVPRIPFPQDKAKTDGELAVDEAIRRGCTRFVLVGAFGGTRFDHAFLHAFQALGLKQRGFDVLLADGAQEAAPILPGESDFALEPGTLFSIIGFGPLTGLSIAGAKWPLENRDVATGLSLTMSNIAAGPVTVALKGGQALFIAGSSA